MTVKNKGVGKILRSEVVSVCVWDSKDRLVAILGFRTREEKP